MGGLKSTMTVLVLGGIGIALVGHYSSVWKFIRGYV